MDCMKFMKTLSDKSIDIGVLDPQYGIGESKRTQSRPVTAKQKNGTRLFVSSARKHTAKEWDNERPPRSYFKEIFRVTKNQIIWGGNHFADLLPRSSGWIVWDKVNPESDQSDCELAWTSFPIGVRQIEYMWNGMIQGISFRDGRTGKGDKTKNEKRIHPTQKPIEVYKWIYSDYLQSNTKIPKIQSVLDTHLGGGGNRIVCDMLNIDFYATEIDKEYFDLQEERFRQYKAQQVIQF
jgi:site-specific DNA-methyltransferase (adenine-specific)